MVVTVAYWHLSYIKMLSKHRKLLIVLYENLSKLITCQKFKLNYTL